MKILITGCAGFIGSHLSETLLKQGNIVYGIDNFDSFYPKKNKLDNLENLFISHNFNFIEGDITKVETFRLFPNDFDCVVHLAAKAGVRPSILNPEEYIESNILATQHLLKWMNKNKIKKLVFGSSSSVYGNNLNSPFSESDVVDNPISPYAFTKKSCELLNYTYHHLYNIDVINLRFFTVYGPRQRPDLAIRKFVELIKNDQPITIFGDGQTGRDYTYVGDIVAGIIAAIEYINDNQNIYETINIGNSSPVLLIDLVNTIYDLLQKPKSLQYLPMQEGDVNITFANIDKAKKLLGYSPKTTLRQGLQNFLEWHDEKSRNE